VRLRAARSELLIDAMTIEDRRRIAKSHLALRTINGRVDYLLCRANEMTNSLALHHRTGSTLNGLNRCSITGEPLEAQQFLGQAAAYVFMGFSDSISLESGRIEGSFFPRCRQVLTVGKPLAHAI
jgi:hypothetical protein